MQRLGNEPNHQTKRFPSLREAHLVIQRLTLQGKPWDYDPVIYWDPDLGIYQGSWLYADLSLLLFIFLIYKQNYQILKDPVGFGGERPI